MKYFTITIACVLLIISPLFAQQLNLDSLHFELRNSNEGTTRINTLNALSYKIATDNPDSAIYYAIKARDLAKKLNYPKGIADAYLNLCTASAKLAKDNSEILKYYEDALKIYDSLLKINKSDFAIIRQKAITINNIADNYTKSGKIDEALVLYFNSLSLFKSISDSYRIGGLYNNLGMCYKKQGNFSEALKYHNLSLNQKKENKDKIGEAMSYNNIGVVFNLQGNYFEAIKNYQDALEIFIQLNEKPKIVAEFNNIGGCYESIGNYNQALKHYLSSLKITETLNDKMLLSKSFSRIGDIYLKLNNNNDALKYFNLSVQNAKDAQYFKGISLGWVGLGNVYLNKEEDSLALYYFLKSLEIEKEAKDDIGIATCYNNIAGVYINQNKYTEALEKLIQSSIIFESLGDKENASIAYNNIGGIYVTQKKLNQARQYFNRALTIAAETGSPNIFEYSYYQLAQLDSASGNFKQAFENYKLSIIYRDSIYNEDNTKKLVQSEMQYGFDKKEALTKAEQDKIDALAKAELQKQKVQKYALIGGALLLLALALGLYNRNRFKQRTNKQLEEKNTIITQSYNDLKIAQGQLVQSEKMASLGQLTAGVAHEINNPINFVSANIKPLRRNMDDVKEVIEKYESVIITNQLAEQFKDVESFKKERDFAYTLEEISTLIKGIEEGASRTTEIVKGLRNFSRLDEGEFKKASINEGIESTLLLLNNLLDKKKIEVVKSLGSIPEIKCYPGQINQVFMNVLTNAIDAIGENGKITITTSQQNDKVKISIRDTGKGMSKEVQKKIFDPFFTTKDVGKGTGLGLSISYGIIEKHKGKIEVNSEEGKGSEMVITLPV